MKKKFAFALALMILLTSLTACGGKGKDGASSSSDDAAVSSEVSSAEDSASSSGAVSSPMEVQDPAASNPAGSQTTPTPETTTPQQPAGNGGAAAGQTTQPQSTPQKPATNNHASSGQTTKPQSNPTPPATENKGPAVSDVASAVEGALAPEGQMMSLTADDLSSLYGLDSSSVEGFVGKMPMMNVKATEYLVVKAAPGKTETVKSGMLKRQADLDATWKQYLPEQYELVKNYKLVTKGDYVLFAVGENAQAAVDAFNSAA
ncbi:MAG: DUF4358 domain-containing protein [Butyricicoccus sp.]|nr:DUF4358 domain-containing protein [Butyricicoccus sp.]